MTESTSRARVAEVTAAEALSEAAAGGGPGALLAATGAVVLRYAGIGSAAALAGLAAGLGLTAREQVEPFAARRPLGHGVWSQPAWPNTAPMCMHHELGWLREPPPYLLVACLRPAGSGGRTGVADGREVLAQLPTGLTDRAGEHGWTLVRRYAGGPIGMAWTDAFPGTDRAGVECWAAAEQVELRWEPGRLVTRRTRPAILPTGADGVPAWSNALAFCSEWTLDPPVREYLVTVLGREALPFETELGDGTPFGAADVETVATAYDRATAYVDWRAGDVLLLDNLRAAHSMEPYEGGRETAVLHAGPAQPSVR